MILALRDSMMSDGLSESTQVRANLAFAIKLCTALGAAVWGYSVVVNRISTLEMDVIRMKDEVHSNSEFRVKWPRGELGSLPDDAEQNLRLGYIEEHLKVHSAHIDALRHPTH